MIAAVTANQVIAFGTLAGFLLAVGGGIGRKWGTTKKHRIAEQERAKKFQESEERADAKRDLLLQELTWAVAGKPPDQWNPEGIPGLSEQIAIHKKQNLSFETSTADMFKKLLDRADRNEAQIAEAAAVAAKAVLATASSVATDATAAAAVASAELLATAIAAKLALVIPKPPRASRAVKK